LDCKSQLVNVEMEGLVNIHYPEKRDGFLDIAGAAHYNRL
jgi:hypothetical protein